MDSLKRRRAAQAGAITRILHKLQRAQAEDTDLLNIPQLDRHIVSINNASEMYKQVHADIIDQHPDEVNPVEEDETLAQHMDAYEEAELLAHLLLSTASAFNHACSIQEQVREIERMMGESPGKSYDTCIAAVTDELSKIKAKINRSSIPHRHDIRWLVSELTSAVAELTATERRPPSSLDTSSSTRCSSGNKQVQLPKIALPTFSGDPMKWAAFWNQFQAAVHDKDDLSAAHKLAYLRSAIKDPQASPLLFSATESDHHYEDMITLLKRRYEKKRLIHKNYS